MLLLRRLPHDHHRNRNSLCEGERRTARGPGGGYLLTHGPAHISIGSILRELEGPVSIANCLDPDEGCHRVAGCVTHTLWRSLGEKIEAFLSTITLDDLLKDESLLMSAAEEDRVTPIKQGKALKAGQR